MRFAPDISSCITWKPSLIPIHGRRLARTLQASSPLEEIAMTSLTLFLEVPPRLSFSLSLASFSLLKSYSIIVVLRVATVMVVLAVFAFPLLAILLSCNYVLVPLVDIATEIAGVHSSPQEERTERYRMNGVWGAVSGQR